MTTPAIIIGLLMGPWLLRALFALLTKQTARNSTLAGCVGISLVFCFTGVGHFVRTAPMAEMLPPWVPARIPLVYITGVIELVAAVVLLIPAVRGLTGLGLIAMLVLFLPVNIYSAVNHVGMGGHQWGPIYLLIRVPLQAVLIAWIWWFAIRAQGDSPIRIQCTATFTMPPEEIAAQILNLEKWPQFQGYGILPGIRSAEFETKTSETVGTKIRVHNTDGSTHLEEIVEWHPEQRLLLRLYDFSPPLSRLARDFYETWEFERTGDKTHVTRTLEINARSALTRACLDVIALLLKKAIARHLRQLTKAGLVCSPELRVQSPKNQ